MGPLKSTSSSGRNSLKLDLSKMVMSRNTHKVKSSEPRHPVRQTVKKQNTFSVGYQTYRLFNRPSWYDKTVSSYVAKLAAKVKSQLKPHFFISRDSISIIGYLATFKLAYDTNHFHERVAMWMQPNFVQERLANFLNSCMYRKDSLALFAALVRSQEP